MRENVLRTDDWQSHPQPDLFLERARLKGLSEDGNSLVCRFDSNRVITYANKLLGSVLEVHPGEMLGRTFPPLIHREDEPLFDARFPHMISERESGRLPNPIGIRVVLDNGELRFQQWQIRGIQDRSGRVVEFQAVGTDMTESHKNRTIEARLELTNDFVREVVHDLNNVLMALSGNIEMARLLIDNRPRLSQKLEAAESHLKRILDLTRQLHSIGNEQDPNRELVNPGEMVRELLSSLLLDSQVKWEITGDHRIYHVWFDPRELERVFLNIFQNACDAMDGVGTIRVDFSKSTLGFSSARDLGSFLRIQIYDTGCGMSKDVLARIFERDFTTKPTGKGIGLCIVSRIIHEFGGTIQAQSKIGHGSVFEISLPLPE